MRLVGLVVRARTRSFAATHVDANVTFARAWFGNEWISVILVWRVCFSNMVVVVGTCSPLQQRLKTAEGSTWIFHRSRCVVSSSKHMVAMCC